LIDIKHNWYLVWGWVWVHGYWLTQQSLFFQLTSKPFSIHYVAQLVGPPPSFNPWFLTLHLWLIFRSYGDPPFSLHPWWVKMVTHDVVWYVLHLLWRMQNFMFYMNRPIFSTTCPSIFTSMGQHCDFRGWCLNVS
jgi:hypothetical protein